MSNWKNYKSPNIGLLFYKKIYSENVIIKKLKSDNSELKFDVTEKKSEFKDFYRDMTDLKIDDYYIPQTSNSHNSFSLLTIYPGLLIGSGYNHFSPSIGDFKIGFYFDYTTGLPVIPGSSIKGVLRSFFEIDINKDGKCFTGEKSVLAIKFIINEIFENVKKNKITIPNEIKENLKEIENKLDIPSLQEIKVAIFGEDKKIGQDIFFDAVIDKTLTRNTKFIAEDFITPHHHDFLKNPKPLQFLKVLPDVSFKFSFKFSKYGSSEVIKEIIFKHIILCYGLGAKTNVGYGQFSKVDNIEQGTKTEPEKKKIVANDNIPDAAISFLSKDNKFDAVVTNVNDDYVEFRFEAGDKQCVIIRNRVKYNDFNLNDKVKAHINKTYKKDGNPLNVKFKKI